MKPSERLKEIEHIFSVYPRSVISEEMKWLINRVKRLEEALEGFAEFETIVCPDGKRYPIGIVARKALEGDE